MEGRLGLRETKKAQAREVIVREALRLFAEQGFAGTTVEQIAAAANLSPRTLFRYFPTKDAIVLAGSDGDSFADVVRRQPTELSAVEAVRAAVRETFGPLDEGQREQQLRRERLIARTPELAAVALTHVRDNIDALTAALQARSAPGARQLAGFVVGLLLAFDVPEQPTDERFADRIEPGLDDLARAFPG